MTSRILALLVLSANLAAADVRPRPRSDSLEAALASEHDAATRERYHAQLTTIAERDIVTAQITRDTALRQWDRSVRAHQDEEARRWAKRHSLALREESNAQERAAYYARERDQARADFEVAAAKVRRLERRASR